VSYWTEVSPSVYVGEAGWDLFFCNNSLKTWMSRKGNIEPIILFPFCIERKQGSELDEAMGISRIL